MGPGRAGALEDWLQGLWSPTLTLEEREHRGRKTWERTTGPLSPPAFPSPAPASLGPRQNPGGQGLDHQESVSTGIAQEEKYRVMLKESKGEKPTYQF